MPLTSRIGLVRLPSATAAWTRWHARACGHGGKGERGTRSPGPARPSRCSNLVTACRRSSRPRPPWPRPTGRLAHGDGPVAVDAERASGYRYGQRAYLVQLRRAGAGTVLIDPIACPDLSGVDAALADAEAVLHAASQDLPCLAEVGYRPRQLFDTELAGRLLGYPRVALGTLVEEVLGFPLDKGHSAADWSVRPLRRRLLRYAALDVEVLVELRDALAVELAEQGKADWARQEFARYSPPGPRAAGRTPGGAPRASTGSAAAAGWPWCARCGRPGTGSPRPRTCRPGGSCPTAAIIEAARSAPVSRARAVADHRLHRPPVPAARKGVAGGHR